MKSELSKEEQEELSELSKEEQKKLSEKLRSCNLRTFQEPNELVVGQYSLNGVSYDDILLMARIINEAKPKTTITEIENEVLTVADAIKNVKGEK